MMFFSVIQNTCAEALGMCNDVFFCDTTLDLRLWACAMMFFSVIQNTCAEALGMCNDELGYG